MDTFDLARLASVHQCGISIDAILCFDIRASIEQHGDGVGISKPGCPDQWGVSSRASDRFNLSTRIEQVLHGFGGAKSTRPSERTTDETVTHVDIGTLIDQQTDCFGILGCPGLHECRPPNAIGLIDVRTMVPAAPP